MTIRYAGALSAVAGMLSGMGQMYRPTSAPDMREIVSGESRRVRIRGFRSHWNGHVWVNPSRCYPYNSVKRGWPAP